MHFVNNKLNINKPNVNNNLNTIKIYFQMFTLFRLTPVFLKLRNKKKQKEKDKDHYLPDAPNIKKEGNAERNTRHE